ncbi:MAG: hypothetical protein H6Q94_474, partial [Nitrospirae bacterium]|nr:hypothetical protein [Nitrospirota bacterium]
CQDSFLFQHVRYSVIEERLRYRYNVPWSGNIVTYENQVDYL